MIAGIYTSASGMIAYQTQMDVVANNLANVSTTGFKKDEAVFTAFPSWVIHRVNDNIVPMGSGALDLRPAIGVRGGGVQVMDNNVIPRFDQGSLQGTDNPFDLAIEGSGFFSVQTPQGIRYTRNGNFTLSSNKELVNMEGCQVLGNDNKPIVINGDKVNVIGDGSVYVDGIKTNQVALTEFANPQSLTKQGDGLFIAPQGVALNTGTPQSRVHQGSLESSNVNTIGEMVKMIATMRAYEASQRMISYQDSTLGHAVNDIARMA